MTLAPSRSSPALPAGLEPLRLPWNLPLSPDQFAQVCQANPDAVLELAADGRLIAMAPTGEQRRGFAPVCPDLVLELASPSDEGPRGLPALRQKMELYRANGALLGWLLIPEQQAVEIWRSDQAEPERLEQASQLDGGQPFPGLSLDLAEVWAG